MTTPNNAGFANGSIHSVTTLAPSWRGPVQAHGYTHFFVINGSVHFVTFTPPVSAAA